MPSSPADSLSDNKPLPAGWTRKFSESNSRYYYVFAQNNHSRWHYPTASEVADPVEAKRRADERISRQSGSQSRTEHEEQPNLVNEHGEIHPDGSARSRHSNNNQNRKRGRSDHQDVEQVRKRPRLSYEQLLTENDALRRERDIAITALTNVKEEKRILKEDRDNCEEKMVEAQKAARDYHAELETLKATVQNDFSTMVNAQVGCYVRDSLREEIIVSTTDIPFRGVLRRTTKYSDVCDLVARNSRHIDWGKLGLTRHDLQHFNRKFGELCQDRLAIAHPVQRCAESASYLRTVFDSVCNFLCNGDFENARPGLKRTLTSQLMHVQSKIVNENNRRMGLRRHTM